MISARLTDGTTTINLNDGAPFQILELELGYGDPSEREISGNIRLFAMDTIANLRTEIQGVQKLLQQAINYWRYDKGATIKDSDNYMVYLEVQMASGEDYYRSPITKARYTMPNDTTWAISIGGTSVPIEYSIDFNRRNYWEGAEVSIGLITHIETTKTVTFTTV